MIKSYRYRNIKLPIEDGKEVQFSVELLSDGNRSAANIRTSVKEFYTIQNSGSTFIGMSQNLRDRLIVVTCNVVNPIPEEDEISVEFKVNGTSILLHSKPKSEADEQAIYLYMKFTKP
jgi:hypothetical protein